MTNEEQELLKDLSARLPYGVICKVFDGINGFSEDVLREITKDVVDVKVKVGILQLPISEVKPYLRSISSMTEEERKESRKILCVDYAPHDCPLFDCDFSVTTFYTHNEAEEVEFYDMKIMLAYIDYLNANYFDYRGLIDKGLAIEAPEGMYN